MHSRRCAILVSLFLLPPIQTGVTINENSATVTLPTSIDFHLDASSDVPIESVELEFRTDALVCGESASEVVPDEFAVGRSITADWTWDLRRTGSLPLGATVSWRWVLYTESGDRLDTPEQHIVLTDDAHPWQTLESESLALHWYEGSAEFAQTLFDAGEEALARLEETIGVDVPQQIRVYIYPSSEEMQSATLFAPSWSGGLAFSRHSALFLAVDPASLAWGQRAIAHELTHVVVGHYTFSCVTSTPTWVDEGLAMFMEGEPDPYYVSVLDQAVQDNKLLSVRELGYIFSGSSDLATLSYAQSLSLITYLIQEHGQENILLLLDQFGEGASEDTALTAVYGFDRDGLEAAWRSWIGAPPMEEQPASVDATRTPYPTLVPIDEPPAAVAEVRPTLHYLTDAPEVSTNPEPVEAAPSRTNTLLIGAAVLVCTGVLLLSAMIGVAAWWSRRQNKTG